MQTNPLEPRISAGAPQPLKAFKPPLEKEQEAGPPADSFTKEDAQVMQKPGIDPGKENLLIDPGRTIDEALSLLSDATSSMDWAKSGLNNAGYSVRNAESALRRADFSLRRVQMDNDKTDMSNEGFMLDMYFSDAKRETGSAGRGVNDADSRVDRSNDSLASSYSKVERLERELQSEGPTYSSVLTHLRKAKNDIAQAQRGGKDSDRDIHDTDRDVDRAESDLTWISSDIMTIKMDGPGKNVSHAGYSLASTSQRTGNDLNSAESTMRRADMDMRDTLQNINYAADALRRAKSELGTIKP
ncbi:MAG: hypothetical protein RDV48_00310 [Candidatus Eremiobacteraeota bacterium]|nr:hypothetical protein [Candidatus Eremiobacteraeota bacterium]